MGACVHVPYQTLKKGKRRSYSEFLNHMIVTGHDDRISLVSGKHLVAWCWWLQIMLVFYSYYLQGDESCSQWLDQRLNCFGSHQYGQSLVNQPILFLCSKYLPRKSLDPKNTAKRILCKKVFGAFWRCFWWFSPFFWWSKVSNLGRCHASNDCGLQNLDGNGSYWPMVVLENVWGAMKLLKPIASH